MVKATDDMNPSKTATATRTGEEIIMDCDDIGFFAFSGLFAVFMIGVGFLLYVGLGHQQEARMACIESGRTWINASCVKVTP